MSELRRSLEVEFTGDLPTEGIFYSALLSSCERALAKAGKCDILLRPRWSTQSSTAAEEGWNMAHYAIGMADEPIDGYVGNFGHVFFDAIIEEFMSEQYILFVYFRVAAEMYYHYRQDSERFHLWHVPGTAKGLVR